MDNTETLGGLETQDTGRRQRKQNKNTTWKAKQLSNMDPTKNAEWGQMLAKGEPLLSSKRIAITSNCLHLAILFWVELITLIRVINIFQTNSIIIKRKLKQWWSTFPLISTKQAITSHLNSMTLNQKNTTTYITL